MVSKNRVARKFLLVSARLNYKLNKSKQHPSAYGRWLLAIKLEVRACVLRRIASHADKNAIGKVMFLTAVAKPRYDNQGNCTFDGKLGI